MKQPAKAPRGKSAPKRKTRAELDMEARERQRQKKQRGLTAGNRANPNKGSDNKKRGGDKPADPRLGSKKAVPLIADGAVASKPVIKRREVAPSMTAREELDALENNERLDTLLDQLENGGKLTAEEQTWLDATLDRIEVLMEKLGINLDEESEEQDQEAEDDMYRLLKGS